MARLVKLLRWGSRSSLAIALAGSFVARSAEPCGMMSGRGVRRPSLAHEQVLVLHDPVTAQEHFIRSITFKSEDRPFGFVVPTPSRPTVAPVSNSPFTGLLGHFDFASAPPSAATLYALSRSGFARLGGGARVLEVSKVGSFTAFVLAADDEGALRKWLTDNEFVTTPETNAWLSHYVRLGFYYVAFRYDRSAAHPTPARSPSRERPFRSETVRISFQTPLPYYPYLEPQPPDPASGTERLLDLWLVSPSAGVPVCVRQDGADRTWVRPWREGLRFEKATTALTWAIGEELQPLLPAGELIVQTFQDQKVSRAGFGDVVFAPAEKGALRVPREKLEPLLGLLDPELVPSTPAIKAP